MVKTIAACFSRAYFELARSRVAERESARRQRSILFWRSSRAEPSGAERSEAKRCAVEFTLKEGCKISSPQ